MKGGIAYPFRYFDIAVHSRVASGTSASSSRGSISAPGGPSSMAQTYVVTRATWVVLYANQPVTIAAGDGKLPRPSIFVLESRRGKHHELLLSDRCDRPFPRQAK